MVRNSAASLIRGRLLRVREIPRDLDAIIRIDAAQETDPTDVGLRRVNLDQIWY